MSYNNGLEVTPLVYRFITSVGARKMQDNSVDPQELLNVVQYVLLKNSVSLEKAALKEVLLRLNYDREDVDSLQY